MSFLGLKEILGLETTEFQEYSPPQRKNENLSVSSLLTVGKVNGVAWSDLIYKELDEEEKSRKHDSSGKEEIQPQDLPLLSQSPPKLTLSAINNVCKGIHKFSSVSNLILYSFITHLNYRIEFGT